MTHPDRANLERVVPGPDYPEVRPRSAAIIPWTLLDVAVWVVFVLAVSAAASQRGPEHSSPSPAEPAGGAGEAAQAHAGAPHDTRFVVDAFVPADPARPESGSGPGGAPLTYTGRASWYGTGPGGFTAAAPWWRSGMDPEDVSVCRIDAGRSDCIVVTVLDHCQCYVGERRARVIDLSRDAFAALAPLSVGLIRVQVDRGATPTLPPTHEETP